jgi:hypothetical protein
MVCVRYISVNTLHKEEEEEEEDDDDNNNKSTISRNYRKQLHWAQHAYCGTC